MKVFQKISSGLLLYDDFTGPSLVSGLISEADVTMGSGFIEFSSGKVYTNSIDLSNVVVQVKNVSVPVDANILGGIIIGNGLIENKLYEYHDPSSTDGIIDTIKVVKSGSKLSGYGSSIDGQWFYRGDMIMAGVTLMGIGSDGTLPFRSTELAFYKNEQVQIHSMLPGYVVNIFDNLANLVHAETLTSQGITVNLPYYPFSGNVIVYNDLGDLIMNSPVTDVWGGDEYAVAVNVKLYDDGGVELSRTLPTSLGELESSLEEFLFSVENLSPAANSALITVADYSQGYDYVWLAEDVAGEPGVYGKSVDVSMVALGTTPFWVKLQRPGDAVPQIFGAEANEQLFYLEVF